VNFRLAAAVFDSHLTAIDRSNRAAQQGPGGGGNVMWFWQEAATWPIWPTWPDFAALARRMADDESGLRREFWRKLKREVASIPFLEDALTAHYCAFDRNTPIHVKAVLVGAIVYFVAPDDLVPDYLSIIGLADDAAVLGMAIKLMSSHIKPEHREAARRMVARLREG
jgi:uncharacterized membrane protein YkvA (DUF1232 family)